MRYRLVILLCRVYPFWDPPTLQSFSSVNEVSSHPVEGLGLGVGVINIGRVKPFETVTVIKGFRDTIDLT